MCLCISSKISLPWDDSSNSFYSKSDSEDTYISKPDISKPHQIPEPPNPPNQGKQPITNLYQSQPPPHPCQNLLTTLQSWVLPNLPNQLTNPPANPIDQGEIPIPAIIKIDAIPPLLDPTQPQSTLPKLYLHHQPPTTTGETK